MTGGLTAEALNWRLESTFLKSYTGDGLFQLNMYVEAGSQMLLEAEMEMQIRYRREGISSRSEAESLLADFPWPVDPCSPDGKPIQYRPVEDGLRLWSVAWDGVDQRGELIKGNRKGDIAVTIPWPTPP